MPPTTDILTAVRRLEALGRLLSQARDVNNAVKVAKMLDGPKRSLGPYAPVPLPLEVPERPVPDLDVGEAVVRRIITLGWQTVQDCIARVASVKTTIEYNGSPHAMATLTTVIDSLAMFEKFEKEEIFHALFRIRANPSDKASIEVKTESQSHPTNTTTAESNVPEIKPVTEKPPIEEEKEKPPVEEEKEKKPAPVIVDGGSSRRGLPSWLSSDVKAGLLQTLGIGKSRRGTIPQAEEPANESVQSVEQSEKPKERQRRPRGVTVAAPKRATSAMREVLIQWWRKTRGETLSHIDLIGGSTGSYPERMLRLRQYLQLEIDAGGKYREAHSRLIALRVQLDSLMTILERMTCLSRNYSFVHKLLEKEEKPREKHLGKMRLNHGAFTSMSTKFDESYAAIHNDDVAQFDYVFERLGPLGGLEKQYQLMLGLLRARPQVLAPLYLHTGSLEAVQLQKSIERLFEDGIDPQEQLPYFYYVVSVIDAQMAESNAPADFLRTDSKVTKLLAAFSRRRLSKLHLKHALKSAITPVLESNLNLEVDPDKLGFNDEEKLKIQADLLQKHCDQVLLSVVTALPFMPYGLRWVCRRMIMLVRHHFPDIEVYEERQLLASFIFLRYISPAVIRPDLCGVLPMGTPISSKAKRNLMLIGKVLQALANECHFGVKEQWLVPMNPFIERCLPLVAAYLDALVDVNDDPVDGLGGYLLRKTELSGWYAKQSRPIYVTQNDTFCIHRALGDEKIRAGTVKDDNPSDEDEDDNRYHTFEPVNLTSPTFCDVCEQFVWGMYKAGWRCTNCKMMAHTKCKKKARQNCESRRIMIAALLTSANTRMAQGLGLGKLENEFGSQLWTLLDAMGKYPDNVPASQERLLAIRPAPEVIRDWLVDVPPDTPPNFAKVQSAVLALSDTLLSVSERVLGMNSNNSNTNTPLAMLSNIKDSIGTRVAPFIIQLKRLLFCVKNCSVDPDLSSDGMCELLRIAETSYNTRQCFQISILTEVEGLQEEIDNVRNEVGKKKEEVNQREAALRLLLGKDESVGANILSRASGANDFSPFGTGWPYDLKKIFKHKIAVQGPPGIPSLESKNGGGTLNVIHTPTVSEYLTFNMQIQVDGRPVKSCVFDVINLFAMLSDGPVVVAEGFVFRVPALIIFLCQHVK